MNNLAYLKVSGPDAAKFLQGQLSCDILALSESQPQLGAVCTPQGKVVATFKIILVDETYYLRMPATTVPLVDKHLSKYAIFSKVSLEQNTSLETDSFDDNWQEQDINNGIPNIYPETSELFFPHNLNLDQLQALSFTKGCYTGQEIIARTQYRGKVKKRLEQIKLDKAYKPGETLTLEDGRTACVVDCTSGGTCCLVV